MNRIYKNWGYLLVSNIFSAGISFFTFIFLAKKLSPDGYGAFNTLIATVILFVTFANNIVAGTVINREIVSQPKAGKHLVKKAIYLRALGFAVVSIALVVYQYLTNKNEGIILASLIALMFSNVVWELCEQIAFGYFVTKITMLLKISVSVMWLVVVIMIPLKYATLKAFFLLYTLIMLIRSICYWLIDKKILDKNDEKSNVSTKQLIRMSIPYLWMRIMGAFSNQIPILLLNGYSGTAQVAYYSVGYKFALPIIVMINSGISAIFPFLTKLYKEDIESYKKKVAIAFVFILIFGSTVAAFLTTTSSYWLIWIMGERYASSVEAFNYQVWFVICLGFDLILSMIFSSSYKQKTLAIITTIDMFILLLILFFCIPYGAKGVAIAKLIGVLISLLYHIFIVIIVLKIKLNNPMFYLSCCYFVILLIGSMFISQIWIKSGLYVIVIFVYLIFKNSPLRSMITLVRDKLKNMNRGAKQ
ncbi:MAG: oligosaccharide flippase family protein [Candidatus Odinarchaeia archaeon]